MFEREMLEPRGRVAKAVITAEQRTFELWPWPCKCFSGSGCVKQAAVLGHVARWVKHSLQL